MQSVLKSTGVKVPGEHLERLLEVIRTLSRFLYNAGRLYFTVRQKYAVYIRRLLDELFGRTPEVGSAT